MSKRPMSILLTLGMVLMLLLATAPVQAAGTTRTFNLISYSLEITDVYATGSSYGYDPIGQYYFTHVYVPAGATITVKNVDYSNVYSQISRYLLWPFNEMNLSVGLDEARPEYACEYEEAIYVEFQEGSPITVQEFYEYTFDGTDGAGETDTTRNSNFYIVRVFGLDDVELAKIGGPQPAPKPIPPAGSILATPSKTEFVVRGKMFDNPQQVKSAYTINQTNYLQLRGIAAVLNDTAAQFNVGWDGEYVVIEPGKPFSGTVTGGRMRDTMDLRRSDLKFKMNGEVFSFSDAWLINGSTNYIQLREFAQKLSGTASQFNVYWDSAANQAVIQPGAPYVGVKYEKPVTVLKQVTVDEGLLPSGEYYLQIFGKYVYPVWGSDYWLELHDKRPEKPFTITLISNDDDRGPKYSIAYDGRYIMLPGSVEGKQLVSTASSQPHYWRINMYSSYGTIRDYLKQKLVVNASGKSSANGTLIIGWTHTDVPDNAKITFWTEDTQNGVTTVAYVQSYPTKTNYKVGEGFDATGLSAVIDEGGVLRGVNDQITFYTSKTVELTQGRPFQTEGKKVVEIRYKGTKIAEYDIVVTVD